MIWLNRSLVLRWTYHRVISYETSHFFHRKYLYHKSRQLLVSCRSNVPNHKKNHYQSDNLFHNSSMRNKMTIADDNPIVTRQTFHFFLWGRQLCNSSAINASNPQLTTLQFSPHHPWVNWQRNIRSHQLFVNNSKTVWLIRTHCFTAYQIKVFLRGRFLYKLKW
jgi:hypothetical protein